MSDFPTVPLSDSVLNGPSGDGGSHAAPPDHRPEQVGPYRILELIGEGGMGEVYKAERRHPIRQTVAVKIIKLGFDSREIVGRFESERQALAMMDHPGIAKVLDAGTTEQGRPFFAMEFVAGRPITQFCDENRLSIGDRLRLFSDVCDAIGHAHTKAIIHRDIKPSNVLAYVQDGTPAVKVIDFGVAKALTSSRLTDLTVNTQSGRPIGTYDCMSPEQVEGSADIDTRTDVYSLGVLLYELLTGAKPFDHATISTGTDDEIKRIIREVDPPRPSTRLSSLGAGAIALAERRQARLDSLAKQLRGELEWIPLKAMRKQRNRRYSSPLQLKEDIQNYLDGRPLIAGPESRTYRARKFVSRNRGGVATAAIISVAFITGIVIYVSSIRAEQKRTRDALAEAERQKTTALEQERLAKEQASISDATNKFLASMLRSSDPAKALGDKVTVVQATQAAMKDLDNGALKDQPIVEAAVRMTIGAALSSLGRYDEALRNNQRALEIRRQVLPADDPRIAASLNNLGTFYISLGKYSEAEPPLREALQIRMARLGPGNNETITALSNLANAVDLQGKFAEAEPLYRRVVEQQRIASGKDDRAVAGAIASLATFLYRQKRPNEAEPLLVQALQIRRDVLPPSHPDIAHSLNSLGHIQSLAGNQEVAEASHREALAIRRKVFPEGHPEIAIGLDNLAVTLFRQNRLPEAEPLAREAVDIRRKALGDQHPSLATSLVTLATIQGAQGKLDESESGFREALTILKAKFGPRGAATTQTAGKLADLLDQTNRPDEAAALRRERETTRPTSNPGG